MGTYTTNYNLFLPSIGEQGWGDLVNGNFSTIDATMKGLNTRVGTLETEGDAVANRVGTLESKVSVLDTGNFGNVNGGNITMNTVTADTVSTKPVHIQNSVAKWLEDASNYIYKDLVLLTMPSQNEKSGTSFTLTIPASTTTFVTPWSKHTVVPPNSVTVRYTLSNLDNYFTRVTNITLDGTALLTNSVDVNRNNSYGFNITFNPSVKHTLIVSYRDRDNSAKSGVLKASPNKSKLILCE